MANGVEQFNNLADWLMSGQKKDSSAGRSAGTGKGDGDCCEGAHGPRVLFAAGHRGGLGQEEKKLALSLMRAFIKQ